MLTLPAQKLVAAEDLKKLSQEKRNQPMYKLMQLPVDINTEGFDEMSPEMKEKIAKKMIIQALRGKFTPLYKIPKPKTGAAAKKSKEGEEDRLFNPYTQFNFSTNRGKRDFKSKQIIEPADPYNAKCFVYAEDGTIIAKELKKENDAGLPDDDPTKKVIIGKWDLVRVMHSTWAIVVITEKGEWNYSRYVKDVCLRPTRHAKGAEGEHENPFAN